MSMNDESVSLDAEIESMRQVMLRKLADEVVFLKKAIQAARREMMLARPQKAFDILCNEISRWGDLPQPGGPDEQENK